MLKSLKTDFLCGFFLKLPCFLFTIKEGINDLKSVFYDVDDKICACYLYVYPSPWYLIVVTWLKRGVGHPPHEYVLISFIYKNQAKLMIIYCAISIFHLYLFCICSSFLQQYYFLLQININL